MSRPLSRPLTWTDQQLSDAVKTSTNWRTVMRELGYGERSSSAGAIRIVRRRAVQLGLDSSHFRGKRRWSDAQLRQAVAESRSWVDVLTALGLSSTDSSAQPHVKGHTIRLDLDTSHLNRVSHRGPHPPAAPSDLSGIPAALKYLRVAGPTIAAGWFALRGCAVSFPFEPTAYDLLVDGPGGIAAVQVKTTTNFTKDGWTVTVGHHPDTHAKKGYLLAYDPDVIDLFFIIDGDMTMYLVPIRAVAGRVRIVLRTYKKYIVGNAAGLLGTGPTAPTAGVPAVE
jgi:hypothetical protein